MPKNSLRVHEVGAGLRSLDIFQFDLTLREKPVAHPFATGYRNTSDDDLLIAVLEGDNRVNDKNEFIPPAKVGLITHLGAGEHLSHGGWQALKLKPVTATVAMGMMGFQVLSFSATSGKYYLVATIPPNKSGNSMMFVDDNLDVVFDIPSFVAQYEPASWLLSATASATVSIKPMLVEFFLASGNNVKVYEIVPWKLSELAVII